ncbi:MAG: hypothetical protein AABX72_01190 [Nanoarchaeota archaeon]
MRVFSLFLIFFLVFLIGCAEIPIENGKINSFDECARAGYPIMESYPRQCATPDGRTFAEEAVTEICRYPQECGPGFYCRHGVCTEVQYNNECTKDDECMLIDNTLGFSCCYAGACQIINYSEDKWTAVNAQWFAQMRQEFCPSKEECGPAPMCPEHFANEQFKAKCTTPIYCIRAPCPVGLCEKVPVE